MSKKLIHHLYTEFANKFDLNYSNEFSDKEHRSFIADLNRKDKKIFELISSFEEAEDSLSFIEKEKEMRIKFPDIWKMQHQQHKDALEIIKNQLMDLGDIHKVNIVQVFKDHENKGLSLEDFKEIS